MKTILYGINLLYVATGETISAAGPLTPVAVAKTDRSRATFPDTKRLKKEARVPRGSRLTFVTMKSLTRIEGLYAGFEVSGRRRPAIVFFSMDQLLNARRT
jgi:hypothetical protein